MIDLDLLKQILIIAIASGCATTLAVQKVKEVLTKKDLLFYISFGISMIVGTLFAKSFSDANWLYSIWAGFFTWLDADLLYKALEDKVFTKFADMKKVTKIERVIEDESLS